MSKTDKNLKAAIVDYGLGNLFSVKHACEHVGMEAAITPSKADILGADVVILPGVGAYGDAMKVLHRLDLVRPLQDIAHSDKLLVGICLGQQLFMTESYEFGIHKGLDIIEGVVVRFENPVDSIGLDEHRIQRTLKVPQIGWNAICPAPGTSWKGTLLEEQPPGTFMYFVHSYYVKPQKPEVTLAISNYGGIEFCSALQYGNIFACQFHPERSGPLGLQIYKRIAEAARRD